MAICAGTQLFAVNVKEDVISFSLTRWYQVSVSTSSANNAGTWSAPPTYYKMTSTSVNNTTILQAIAAVLHWPKTGYYSTRAQIVLVQPEIGGFFGYPYAGEAAGNVNPDLQDQASTVTGDNIRFAQGRNMTNNPITGALPPGHNQPWGQIYVKDYDTKGNVTLCENVSFFFAIQVQECYDCFYLNSFITTATFKFKGRAGPPCCAGSSVTQGSGTDKYYMTLQFDNTLNNPYLNPYYGEEETLGVTANISGYAYDYGHRAWPPDNWMNFYGWVGGTSDATGATPGYPHNTNGLFPNIIGLLEHDDGIQPDGLPYLDLIENTVVNPPDHHAWDVYTLRFALNGILTYQWVLSFLNTANTFPDFVQANANTPASFPCTGFGYAAKVCSLFSGTVTITEKVMATSKCCLDVPWSDVDLGGGSTIGLISAASPNGQTGVYWFGIGDNDVRVRLGTNWDNGEIENYKDTSGENHIGDDVQVNTDMDLSLHVNFDHNYDPLVELTWHHYPQPGFEGYWDSYFGPAPLYGSDPSASFGEIYDWQTPQEDNRPADTYPTSSD